MRTQTGFRTYPPLSSSAGWGAGNKDQKNEKDEQRGHKLSARTLMSNRVKIAATLIAGMVLSTTSLAFGKSPKVSDDLASQPQGSSADVIVQFTQTATSKHYPKVLNRGGRWWVQTEAFTW